MCYIYVLFYHIFVRFRQFEQTVGIMTAVVAGQQDQNIHKKYTTGLGNYDGRYYRLTCPVSCTALYVSISCRNWVVGTMIVSGTGGR